MNDTTKKTRVLTADDLAGLLEAAVNKIAKPRSQARPNIEDLRKKQDAAILQRELAQEKRARVRKAIEREAPLEEQVAALGGEDALSPLQLVKLKRQTPALPRSDGHDLARQVLGPAPSTREMERLADIRLKLQGTGVESNERGEIEIGGYPIPGSNLGTALRFLVKGSRGFKEHPSGVAELGDLLRQRGVASSKFPESVRPLLGGRTGRRSRKKVQTSSGSMMPSLVDPSSDGYDEAADESLGGDDEDDDHQQQGSGLLHQAMDHAEHGYHDEAWDALNEARQLKVPREKLKKVEVYLASLRD